MKASLRAERESLSLRKGLMSKTLVRPFLLLSQHPPFSDKEDKTKQGEGESIEEKEAKEGCENKEEEVKSWEEARRGEGVI